MRGERGRDIARRDGHALRSCVFQAIKGDPSTAAPLSRQRVVAGVLWLIWVVACFFLAGRVLVGLAALTLPTVWFVLAWRAHKSSSGSCAGADVHCDCGTQRPS